MSAEDGSQTLERGRNPSEEQRSGNAEYPQGRKTYTGGDKCQRWTNHLAKGITFQNKMSHNYCSSFNVSLLRTVVVEEAGRGGVVCGGGGRGDWQQTPDFCFYFFSRT